ncbi:MAG TPA: OB-fold domain-containing protein [Acidimicrobiales bacterium]|nr:OB-fold domain-containing protein [Acidimicrobiales bacterium]
MDPLVIEAFTRPEPTPSDRTRAFWAGGADGLLRITRCGDCGRYCHPPLPVCPACRRSRLAPEPVSGRGTIYSWTVSRYEWQAEMPPPYIVAQVELVEQPGLRLITNIVGSDTVDIGADVEVCFARSGDAFIPLFRVVER